MGALTLIRFVRARGKLMKQISLIRHFVHETFVRVRRRIHGILMELKHLGKTLGQLSLNITLLFMRFHCGVMCTLVTTCALYCIQYDTLHLTSKTQL